MKPTELDAAPWIHELLNAMHNEWGTPTATILGSRMVVLTARSDGSMVEAAIFKAPARVLLLPPVGASL
jgi:hypothetical protein